MIEFVQDRWADIAYRSYQHASLVTQAVVIATLYRGLAVVGIEAGAR